MIDLIKGDCLIEMQNIPDKSVDMILADLPYGTTACKWDVIIPFDKLWKQYERIIIRNGAIVLFASQPFTSSLVISNINMFRYSLVWDKGYACDFAMARNKILKRHEDIIIFSFAAAKMGMSNKIFMILLAIGSIIFSVVLGEAFYILVILIIGIITFKGVARLTGS